MNLTTLRDTFTAAETVGKMTIAEVPTFSVDTIEQPRNHDVPNKSCIPVGTYRMVPHVSGHLHEADGVTPLITWALVNPSLGVTHDQSDPIAPYCSYPHRWDVLVHPDNVALTLLGCIGPGQTRQQLPDGAWEVTQSRVAFLRLRNALGTGTIGHTMTIAEAA